MKVNLFFNIYNMGICNRCGRNYPTSSYFWLFDWSLCISCNAKIKKEYDKKYSIDKEEEKNNDVDHKKCDVDRKAKI